MCSRMRSTHSLSAQNPPVPFPASFNTGNAGKAMAVGWTRVDEGSDHFDPTTSVGRLGGASLRGVSWETEIVAPEQTT